MEIKFLWLLNGNENLNYNMIMWMSMMRKLVYPETQLVYMVNSFVIQNFIA